MKIQLIDWNKGMCIEWEKEFKNCNDVIIHHGDFFSLKTDCVVSPANSFGFMDGGLDLLISEKLGWHVQKKLQKQIQEKYFGELLVGQAELVETDNNEIPFLISAPTMRVPSILTASVNVYLASKAIFSVLKREPRIKIITISGLGTGVGMVPYGICARQMKKAYDDIWLSNFKFPQNLFEVQKEHQLLYSDTYRDLQFSKKTVKMKSVEKRSFLYDIPSWILSILWVIVSTLLLFGIGEGVGNIFKINEDIAGAIPYIIFDVLIAVGCFYIIKWNPKSIWYVPLICNAIGIIAAFIEPTFWRTELWMLYCGGWALSLIASIMGARIGRRAAGCDADTVQ